MYEATLEETWELFGPYLDGARAGVFCVASARPLGQEARTALENSAAALGYGRASCTYVTLRGAERGEEEALDGQALFLVMEGLDPLVAVAADAETARSLGKAYRADVAVDAACRLLGRDVVAFASFESILGDAQGKQAAWALLKKLPKLDER